MLSSRLFCVKKGNRQGKKQNLSTSYDTYYLLLIPGWKALSFHPRAQQKSFCLSFAALDTFGKREKETKKEESQTWRGWLAAHSGIFMASANSKTPGDCFEKKGSSSSSNSFFKKSKRNAYNSSVCIYKAAGCS